MIQKIISEKKILQIAYKTLSKEQYKSLTAERWKDGIEIDVVSFQLIKFVEAINDEISRIGAQR